MSGPEKINCPNCGKENNFQSPYCMWCGQGLSGTAALPNSSYAGQGQPPDQSQTVAMPTNQPSGNFAPPSGPTLDPQGYYNNPPPFDQYTAPTQQLNAPPPAYDPYHPQQQGGAYYQQGSQPQMGVPYQPTQQQPQMPPANLVYPQRPVAGPAQGPRYYEAVPLAVVPKKRGFPRWPFILLAVMVLSCLGLYVAWAGFIRPAIEQAILDQIQASVGNQINIVPTQPTIDKRGFRLPVPVSIAQTDANSYLSSNATAFSPAQNAQVSFQPHQVVLFFDLYGQRSTLTGNLSVDQTTHHFIVKVDSINGPAGYVLTKEKLGMMIQNSLNQALDRQPNYTLNSAQVEEGKISLLFREK